MYTKGPWTVENVEYGDEVTDDLCILEGSPNFHCVAHIEPRFDGERIKGMERANANLIAAAPDLLEACRFFLTSFGAINEQQQDALTLASRAIKKAEG